MITQQQFTGGKIFIHQPSKFIGYATNVGSFVFIDNERHPVKRSNEKGFIIEGLGLFSFSDCDLHEINFTQCPHCKKHF